MAGLGCRARAGSRLENGVDCRLRNFTVTFLPSAWGPRWSFATFSVSSAGVGRMFGIYASRASDCCGIGSGATCLEQRLPLESIGIEGTEKEIFQNPAQ